MDPDFGVYVTDEMGNILGVAEIRSRLVAGKSLVVKDVDPQRRELVLAETPGAVTCPTAGNGMPGGARLHPVLV